MCSGRTDQHLQLESNLGLLGQQSCAYFTELLGFLKFSNAGSAKNEITT